MAASTSAVLSAETVVVIKTITITIDGERVEVDVPVTVCPPAVAEGAVTADGAPMTLDYVAQVATGKVVRII